MENSHKAYIACGIVSILPNLVLFFIPKTFLVNPEKLGPHAINYQNIFLAFACGGLLGDVFLHILSHITSKYANQRDAETQLATIGFFVVLGYSFFFVVERISSVFSDNDHSHGDQLHNHNHHASIVERISTTGWLNLLADSMHNFTDGIAIGASFSVATTTFDVDKQILGLTTFISVLLHEIPHEIGDFSILIESGLTKYVKFSCATLCLIY